MVGKSSVIFYLLRHHISNGCPVLGKVRNRDIVQEKLVDLFQRATFELGHAEEEKSHAKEVCSCPDVAILCAL